MTKKGVGSEKLSVFEFLKPLSCVLPHGFINKRATPSLMVFRASKGVGK